MEVCAAIEQKEVEIKSTCVRELRCYNGISSVDNCDSVKREWVHDSGWITIDMDT